MAGDWLPLRLDIHDDPDVLAMANRLNMSCDCVVGKAARLWAWANRHLSDGIARGASMEWVDQYVSAAGFAAAMVEVGWLQIRSGNIHFPDFDVWNSKSAKRRLLDSKAKSLKRVSAKCPHEKRTKTGPEKRREENNKPPFPPFDDSALAPLETQGFHEAWDRFKAYRVESGFGPLQLIPEVENLHALAKLGADRATKLVQRTIRKGWKNIVFDDIDKVEPAEKPVIEYKTGDELHAPYLAEQRARVNAGK